MGGLFSQNWVLLVYMPPEDVNARVNDPVVAEDVPGVVPAVDVQNTVEPQSANGDTDTAPQATASSDVVPTQDSGESAVVVGDASPPFDVFKPPDVVAEPMQEVAATATPEPPATPEYPAVPEADVVYETTQNNAEAMSESNQPAYATPPAVAAGEVQNGQAGAPAADVVEGTQHVQTEAGKPNQPVALPSIPPTTPSSRVLELTDDELKEAAALYLRRHQAEIAAQGVAKRQANMQANFDKIVSFVSSASSPQTVAQIARACSITPRTTASYLQKLVRTNRLKASGHAVSRRYWVG